MIDTVLAAIGDAAALVAALFAFLALRQASKTISEARKDRHEAERNRMRDRVEHVGEILEAMASAAADTPKRFPVHRNRLGFALAGLRERLPKCEELFNDVRTSDQFNGYDISMARNEIDSQLNSLSSEE
jgi:hypothetical protein